MTINNEFTSNNRKLKDYQMMKHSYLVKHYDKTFLMTFDDAISDGYGDLFVVYKYETTLGMHTYKVLVVK